MLRRRLFGAGGMNPAAMMGIGSPLEDLVWSAAPDRIVPWDSSFEAVTGDMFPNVTYVLPLDSYGEIMPTATGLITAMFDKEDPTLPVAERAPNVLKCTNGCTDTAALVDVDLQYGDYDDDGRWIAPMTTDGPRPRVALKLCRDARQLALALPNYIERWGTWRFSSISIRDHGRPQ